jgi:glycosyltransferase involved in cell wall biosynthesis
MTNSNSIVSVVIPCFNQGVFLDQSLRSISEQTFSSWECIIVNDGSTDETGKVAMEWVQKDSRFKYFSIPNGGVSNARNFGIGNAHGTYILPLDADDRIGPRYLEKAVALLDNNTEIHVVYSEAEFFGGKTGRWKLPPFDEHRMLFKNLVFCSAFFRKADFEKVGGYKTNMVSGWEDWDLWLSFIESGFSFYKLGEVHFYYRIQNISRTASLDTKKTELLYKQIFLNHLDLYVRRFGHPVGVYEKYCHMQNSKTWKLGSMLTYLPSLVRSLFKKPDE